MASTPRLFATPQEVMELERAAAGAQGVERLPPLVELSWHLRQRASARAEALAREAQALADPADDASRARIALTLAECALLQLRIEEAEQLARRGAEAFHQSEDATGTGDAWLLQARIADTLGDRPREVNACAEAMRCYAAAGDEERLGHARLMELIASAIGNPARLASEAAAMRSTDAAARPAIAGHLSFVEGFAAFQRGDFLAAASALDAASRETLAEGLIDHAFRADAGLVSAYSNLGDREASCALAERTLARARELGWPRAIGHSLANFARQLASGGHYERAIELLLEACDVLSVLPRSRVYAIASYYLGDAYLAVGRNAEALERLELAEGLMRDLGADPEVACLQAIAAQALSRLGRGPEALARAQGALDLARRIKSRLWEVEALRSLAEAQATHHAALAGGDPRLALGYLEEALAVVEEIGGHHEKSELYTEIARAHEAVGDTGRALATERLARAEELREQNRRAGNQLMLARERHETERQRVEAVLQRSLAAAQSDRAATLESELRTLEDLRRVGQDITAHLDPAAMLVALDGHLARLADVTFSGVFVLDAPGARLRRYAIERGRSLPPSDVALADLESYAASAARERKEIYVDAEEGGRASTRIPGTEVTRSLWFGPLVRGEELLGVLTAQTSSAHAYGEREKLVFRTIAGYTAVAFANARAHAELEEKHRRLIEAEAEMRALATTDPLTGLDNRRRFFAGAESELARAMRYGGALGLIMADLDRFKAVNDRGGHQAGDRVMQAVAATLRAAARPHDVLARLGGEEFALALPGADIEATLSAAERIRAAVAALEVEHDGQRFRITVSLGCAAVVDARSLAGTASEALERLLREADAALYEAKRLGRDRSVAAQENRRALP